MKKPVIIGLIVIVVLFGGVIAYLVASNGGTAGKVTTETTAGDQEPESSNDTAEAGENSDTSTSEASGVTITFTDSGFDKSTYTVKAGQIVTVKNDSSMSVQFSSDDHPTHTEDPEINMSTLASGESGTFTPTTKGTHGFHDHINDQYTGTLVVE